MSGAVVLQTRKRESEGNQHAILLPNCVLCSVYRSKSKPAMSEARVRQPTATELGGGAQKWVEADNIDCSNSEGG